MKKIKPLKTKLKPDPMAQLFALKKAVSSQRFSVTHAIAHPIVSKKRVVKQKMPKTIILWALKDKHPLNSKQPFLVEEQDTYDNVSIFYTEVEATIAWQEMDNDDRYNSEIVKIAIAYED